jgi:hypothetical protein
MSAVLSGKQIMRLACRKHDLRTLANKMARTAWEMLIKQENYRVPVQAVCAPWPGEREASGRHAE